MERLLVAETLRRYLEIGDMIDNAEIKLAKSVNVLKYFALPSEAWSIDLIRRNSVNINFFYPVRPIED